MRIIHSKSKLPQSTQKREYPEVKLQDVCHQFLQYFILYPLRSLTSLYQLWDLSVTYIKSKALSNVSKKTFVNNSIKAWNRAPNVLKNTATVYGAKTAIKNFVKTIPI